MIRGATCGRMALAILLMASWTSCSTGGGGESKRETPEPVKASREKPVEEPREVAEPGGPRSTVVVSLANTAMTGHYVNRVAAQQALQRFQSALRGAGANDKRNIEAVISAGWLSGATLPEVMNAARRLVDLEMKKNVKIDVSDAVKLELALAAIRVRKYSMAEYFLDFIEKSNNPRVRAGVLTCRGLIAAQDDRLVEAVAAWESALQASPKYPPALLNIGFVAAKYGDFKNAASALNQMPDDWYAQSGLIPAQRLAGNNGAVDQLCSAVLTRQPSHKPTLINCALHEWQAKKDLRKARDIIGRATKVQGDPTMDDLAYRLVTDLEMDMQKDRAAADRARAEEQLKGGGKSSKK